MLSIVIPFHNEAKSLPILIVELKKALGKQSYELILVDDGSLERNKLQITSNKSKEENNKIIIAKHRIRLGKGAALKTGASIASGEIIIFKDADLQDDPADIEKLVKKINQGFDVVVGWRKNRQDSSIMKLISKIGNTLIWRRFLKSTLHDVNCGFKAMRRTVLEEIPLYGDNYRFLPLLAEKLGFRVGEVIVNNRKRLYGESKYGVLKSFFGLIDTLTTFFIVTFAEKPLHFFGTVGGVLFGSGFILAIYLSYERLFKGILLYRRPALLLAALLIIVGIQIVMTGVVAELVVYLDKKNKNR